MTSKPLQLQSRVRPNLSTLSRELDGELVMLQLDNENYFGLDEVGTRIFEVVSKADSVGDAIEELLLEFEVERPRLQSDVFELVAQLVDSQLLLVED